MASWVNDWSTRAACRTSDPEELFVHGAAQNRAKAVCSGCPVRTECLADALDNRVEFGIWGGMSEFERRALLRQRPSVASWRRLLETARTEYESATGLLVLDKPAPQVHDPQSPPAPTGWPAELEVLSPPITRQVLSPEQLEQFEAVFRHRFIPLVGFLIAAGAGRHDAEDAVQSALVQLAQKWETVDHPAPWARTTAWRIWMKAKSKETAVSSDPADLPQVAYRDPSPDIAEQLDLVQLLQRLSAMQRTVMAFAIDGAEPTETAEALGVSAGSVRQNLLRARRHLEHILKELAEGDAS